MIQGKGEKGREKVTLRVGKEGWESGSILVPLCSFIGSTKVPTCFSRGMVAVFDDLAQV